MIMLLLIKSCIEEELIIFALFCFRCCFLFVFFLTTMSDFFFIFMHCSLILLENILLCQHIVLFIFCFIRFFFFFFSVLSDGNCIVVDNRSTSVFSCLFYHSVTTYLSNKVCMYCPVLSSCLIQTNTYYCINVLISTSFLRSWERGSRNLPSTFRFMVWTMGYPLLWEFSASQVYTSWWRSLLTLIILRSLP